MGLMTALSLQFFMFILVIFLVELSAAILAFIFREHVCTPQLSTLLPLPPTELWGLPQRASLSYLSHVLCHKPKRDLHPGEGHSTQPSEVSSCRSISRSPHPVLLVGPLSSLVLRIYIQPSDSLLVVGTWPGGWRRQPWSGHVVCQSRLPASLIAYCMGHSFQKLPSAPYPEPSGQGLALQRPELQTGRQEG